MNKYNIKDKKKRKFIYHKESYRFILKSILKNKYFMKTIRLNALLKLSNLDNITNPVSITNRCIETGKNSISSYNFKLSRFALIRYARSGLVSGIRKTF